MERLRQFRADYSSGVCIGSEDDDWRCRKVSGYATGSAPLLTIRYLGVWDTVGALGMPKRLPLSGMLNRRHDYHDVGLTGFVENARHALALDERRALFPPEPWGDLTGINAAKGCAVDATDAPYQEKWFPGTHGSVGGGGNIRGLSDGSLAWVLKGAKRAGLRLDVDQGSRIQAFAPDPLAPLVNLRRPKLSVSGVWKADRTGPDHVWQVSASAVRRWHAAAASLPGGMPYRPRSLVKVAAQLGALPIQTVEAGEWTTHSVAAGDTLGRIARQHYGDAGRADEIFVANRDRLDDPDEIFVGQTLRIPQWPGLHGTVASSATGGSFGDGAE